MKLERPRWPSNRLWSSLRGPRFSRGHKRGKPGSDKYQLLKEYCEAACFMEANWAANFVGSSRSSSLSALYWLSSIIESQTGGLWPWFDPDSSLMNMSSASRGAAALFRLAWERWRMFDWQLDSTGVIATDAVTSVSGASPSIDECFLFLFHSRVIGVVLADPLRRPDFKKYSFLSSSTWLDRDEIHSSVLGRKSSWRCKVSSDIEVSTDVSIVSSLEVVCTIWSNPKYNGSGIIVSVFVLVLILLAVGSIKPSSVKFGMLKRGGTSLIGLGAGFGGLGIDLPARNSDKLDTRGWVGFLRIAGAIVGFVHLVAPARSLLAWTGRPTFFGSVMITGLLLPFACSFVANANNWSAVNVTTLGKPVVVGLGATTFGFFAILGCGVVFAVRVLVVWICFRAIFPASRNLKSNSVTTFLKKARVIRNTCQTYTLATFKSWS